jgi:hypothetical protein
MAALSVLSGKAKELDIDLSQASEGQKLLIYKRTLEAIRDLLLYGTDLRRMTKDTIDILENDIREIIRGLSKVQLNWTEAVLFSLKNAISSLYTASDSLEQTKGSAFYRNLNKCEEYITQALKYFP